MYVPILKWKQGEYQALMRLSNDVSGNVCPLIDIPPIGWDFGRQMLAKNIDEHLKGFGRRYYAKWGEKLAFVDAVLLDPHDRMSDGVHPLIYIFDEIRKHKGNAVPVFSASRDNDYHSSVRNIVSVDHNGACLRLSFNDLLSIDVDAFISNYLVYLGVGSESLDIVLDLQAPNFDPIDVFVSALHTAISRISMIHKVRSFTLSATSFPDSMAKLRKGENFVSRKEWELYTKYINSLDEGDRVPQFGDYTICHPDVVNVDMRFVKPSASIRYTISDEWLIVKGDNVRDYKFHQYVKMCQKIVDSKYFSGSEYSMGDKYIFDCSRGEASTGRLTTWRWVGTNHHITKLVGDLSSLGVL